MDARSAVRKEARERRSKLWFDISAKTARREFQTVSIVHCVSRFNDGNGRKNNGLGICGIGARTMADSLR